MSDSLRLLNDALRLAADEMKALEKGDLDLVAELSENRDRIVAKAFPLPQGEDQEAVKQKLLELRDIQDRLSDEVRAMRRDTMGKLKNTRVQSKRVSAYSRGAGNSPTYAKERFVSKSG